MNNLEIKYPCEWCYTVIGSDEALLRSAVSEVFCGKPHTLEFSKKSKGGKYISLTAVTNTINEEERLKIFGLLAKHPAVKMVL